MINYVFVHLYNDFSGSPRVLKSLASVISKRKSTDKLSLITSSSKGVLDEFPFDSTYFFKYRPVKNSLIKIVWFLLVQVIMFLYVVSVLFKSRKSKNVLIINTMLPFGAAFASVFFPSVDVIYYLHESYIKPNFLKRFLLKCISMSSSRVIYVSEYLKNELKVNISNSEVIYNPVDESMIQDVVFDNKENNIILLSSLVKYKGVDRFIELASFSLSRRNNDFNYILILNSSELDFLKYVDSLNIDLPSNLIVCFRPDNIKDFYAKAKFVVNFTDHELCIETFGLTLAEGMCNGLIPIAPNYGGPKEVIGDGVGYLFDTFDIVAIINYIYEINSTYDESIISKLKLQSDKFRLDNYSYQVNVFLNGVLNEK